MTCPLSRALGRLQAGQSVQDLSYACLTTLEQFTQDPALKQQISDEILSRLSSSSNP